MLAPDWCTCASHFGIEQVRGGIPAWFERPGPTSREAQPVIADAGIRAKVKDKISKVVKRRYLLTMGIIVKSLIKYFAVPKGEDDVRFTMPQPTS